MVHAHEIMRTDYILADINDTVSSLIGQMEKHGQREAIVFDGATYKGLASKKWLLSSRISPAEMKLRNLMTHRSKSKTPFFVPKLSPDTDLKEIARLLATADVHALPVIASVNKKEKVVGVVHALDVLRKLKEEYRKKRVSNLASMKLVTVFEDDQVGMVLQIMHKQGIGHVVVVDGKNRLIGIVGLTDIITDVSVLPRSTMRISKAASHQKGKHTGFGTGEKTNILTLPVHNILTHVPNCCTVAPEASVAVAIGEMIENQVGSAVVMKKDTPVGIITVKDILQDYGKA
jgi:CBS domain-containing protein